MKKLFVAILALLYLVSTAGATVYTHYCMGEIAEKSLWRGNDSDCSRCGMDMEESGNGCCRDEHQTLRLETDQKVTENFYSFISIPVEGPVTEPGVIPDISTGISKVVPKSDAPPRTGSPALYLLHRAFRI